MAAGRAVAAAAMAASSSAVVLLLLLAGGAYADCYNDCFNDCMSRMNQRDYCSYACDKVCSPDAAAAAAAATLPPASLADHRHPSDTKQDADAAVRPAALPEPEPDHPFHETHGAVEPDPSGHVIRPARVPVLP
ncbi:hypothetical protein BDA96_03G073700 [Sorghum bicolor]|uniref:Uncharacterized protein n=1 Tax=Sorghum bicolor TaxID=4558 RepID=A0A921ULH5_SORBI|nr:hypothetical protein BDA96_03G073700 [Sorghum bicolor]